MHDFGSTLAGTSRYSILQSLIVQEAQWEDPWLRHCYIVPVGISHVAMLQRNGDTRSGAGLKWPGSYPTTAHCRNPALVSWLTWKVEDKRIGRTEDAKRGMRGELCD